MDNKNNPGSSAENKDLQQPASLEKEPEETHSSLEDEMFAEPPDDENIDMVWEISVSKEEEPSSAAVQEGETADISTAGSGLQFEALQKQLSELENRFTGLHLDFQSKIKYDAHKEKIIDNLHAELQTYKNGLLEKLLGPVFLDVIEVIDDTRRLLKDIKARGEEGNAEKLWKTLNSIPDDLEDMLDKHGVEVARSQTDQFDPSMQKVVRVVSTDQEQLDKTVQERLKNGYLWQEKLLRREMVNVWQYHKDD